MTEPGPRFSIVSAVCNAGRGLREFVASVEAQTFDLARVEIIMVDEGSNDGSAAALEAWQARRPGLVTAITAPPGGRSRALNLGLTRAGGEWISFPDPDALLDGAYLAEVDAFLHNNPATTMVATRRTAGGDEAGGEPDEPVRKHFTAHNRLRNLRYDTHHFHGDTACAFFPLDGLRRHRLAFDERIRPTFAGGHLCGAYLLRAAEPLVAFLASARYQDRARREQPSTPDPSWADTGRFAAVPQHGYLDLLQDGARRHGGRPPAWLQNMVIHELAQYLRTSSLMYAHTTDDRAVLAHFHELMAQICALLDDDVVAGYDTTRIRPELRDILRHGYRDESWHAPYARVDKLDTDQQAMRLSYRFTGERPHEVFVVGGRPVLPLHEKVRDIRFFDRPVGQERIVWLPYGTVRVVLDGRDLSTQLTEPGAPTHFLDSRAIRRRLDPVPDDHKAGVEGERRWNDGAIEWLARTRIVRRYFGDAWVLMDRIINADDSAEHLFRYLRKHRRGVNAWFVVERRAPDYRRLRNEKYKRVVPYGSLGWKLLMLNAAHLISSHVDHPIVQPEAVVRLGRPRWRFTFLQHGVIKDDISRWLNGKDIDLFVTSTPQEHEWIAGDHTPYRYTTREARMTGLPRFDRIRDEGMKYPPGERDLILIAPTWRQWLIVHEPTENAQRRVDDEQFRSSDYAAQWTAVLNSSGLRELAERTGSRVALLMHPNLQSTLALLDLEAHVETFRFEQQNVQALFARARVVVTDYSSMAFNAAYIDRPIVYFQFDADRMFGGGHIGRRGYFDYGRDGFGPVAHTADDAVAAVTKAVDNGPDPEPEYAQRIARAFPQRDGKCCERAADAIAASTKRLRPRYESGRR